VLSSNDTRFGDKPLRSTEDLDLDGDDIYFVDSSYKYNINEAIQDIVHTFPGGRLFKYNVKHNTIDLLADKLYYPNGVQLTPKKDAVLVNEFSMARIVK
jgi:sugar lactone lactonase YvrE